jgi:prepilin-type processing-associated H-X9-DG protein
MQPSVQRVIGPFASRRLNPRSNCRTAFTQLELLVSLSVIGLLAAITIPAVQQAREASRRTTCTSNIRQIALACSEFETAHQHFPHGWGLSFLVKTLPWLDQLPLYNQFDHAYPDYGSPHNNALGDRRIGILLCPSDPGESVEQIGGTAGTCYVGNFGTGVQKYDYNGMFRAGGPELSVRTADVHDGLSHTALIAEITVSAGDAMPDPRRGTWFTPYPLTAPDEYDAFLELCDKLDATTGVVMWHFHGRGWTWGDVNHTLYNHMLPPNRKSCHNGSRVQQGCYTAASMHGGGVNVAFGDGHVQFISDDVDLGVWRATGSRDGRELTPF